MSQTTLQRGWRFPTPIIQNNVKFVVWVWAAFTVVILAIVTAVGITGILNWDIVERAGGGSGIEGASGIIPWFFLFYLGFHTYQVLPVYIAHGRTRRNAFIEGGIFATVLAAIGAALICISFLIENVVYRIGGWTHGVTGERLFSSPLELHLIFLNYFLTFLIWTLVGAFLGLGFYRSDGLGWLLVIPAIIPLATSGIALQAVVDGPADAPFQPPSEVFGIDLPSIPVALGLTAIAIAITVAMAWPLIRGIPMKSSSS